MELSKRLMDFCLQNDLISPEDRILIALSGGKDSVCLTSLLKKAKEQIPLTLYACHVHHGIRPEANEDLAFCQKLCDKEQIPFYAEYVDVPEIAKKEKLGLEETARSLRYERLVAVAKRIGATKIATAHTASDQAETVLFRLVRGSGSEGLSGILPILPLKIPVIRPLLFLHSEEILRFLEENNLSFTLDLSNLDTLYKRNLIRHEVMPHLKEINPRAEEALCRFSRILQWQNAFLKEELDRIEAREGISFSQGSAPSSVLKDLTKKESTYPLLYLALCRMMGHHAAMTMERFEAICHFLRSDSAGGTLQLSQNTVFRLQDGRFIFCENGDLAPRIDFVKDLAEGENEISSLGITLSLSPEKLGSAQNPDKGAMTIHFSADSLSGRITARSYRSGDLIVIGQMTRSVKKLFCDKKIPTTTRDRIPLICDENGIFWIPGIGLADRARPEKAKIHRTLSLLSENK